MDVIYPKYPFEIEIQLTSGCNLSCAHCFGSFSKANAFQMDIEKVRFILDDMAQKQIHRVTFSGGEALTYKRIDECIQHATNLDIETRVLTNGTIANQKVITRLINAGLRNVGISIDGDQEQHDLNRGVGNYERAIKAIKFFSESGVDFVSVNMMINKNNYHSIGNVIPKLLEAGACYVILLPLQMFGRARDMMNDRYLTPEQLYSLYKRYESDSAAKGKKVFIHGPLGSLLKPAPDRDDANDQYLWQPCQAGQSRLSISSKGDASPCVPLDKPLGNYFTDGLDHIWNQSQLLKDIRNTDLLDDECKNCTYLTKCVGGCRVASYFAYGTIQKKDPFCFKRVIEVVRRDQSTAGILATTL